MERGMKRCSILIPLRWRVGDPLVTVLKYGSAHGWAVGSEELLSSAFGVACKEWGLGRGMGRQECSPERREND